MAPEHIALEVMSALRGVWLGGQLNRPAFEAASRRLESPLDVLPTKPMLPRIVELAANATPYDAAYVTLAERVDAPVLTVDAQLSRISGVPRRFPPGPS